MGGGQDDDKSVCRLSMTNQEDPCSTNQVQLLVSVVEHDKQQR